MHTTIGALVLHPALRKLWDSYRVAQSAAVAGDDSALLPFSHSAETLLGKHDDRNLLPWLISRGYVRLLEAGQTQSRDGRPGKINHAEARHVLTPAGDAWLTRLAATAGEENGEPRDTLSGAKTPGAEFPRWNFEAGELHWNGGKVAFRVSARNLRAILSAFEEEGWPSRVDDPLPPEPDVEPKQRLRDAISNLNQALRKQGLPLRFHGDGSGEAISWNVAEAE